MSLRARIAGLTIAATAIVASSGACTIYASASLGGLGADSPDAIGGCFQLSSTACGKCIATQCEAPNRGSQPTSLAALCQKAPTSDLIRRTQSCAKDPDVQSDSSNNCGTFFGTNTSQYSGALDTQGAIENNLKLCVRDYCLGDCRVCTFTMDDCNKEVPISTSPCGKCIADAIDIGGDCHDKILTSSTCNSSTAGYVEKCATPRGRCHTPDCTSLFSPGTGASSDFKALSTCLAASCQTICQ